MGLVLTVMILSAAALAIKGAADAAQYGNEKSRSLARTTLALTRLCSDLRRAQEITVESPRAVTLTLPGGEQHHYSWSGTDGAPLNMAIAGGESHVLVPEVALFQLQAVNEYSEIAHAVVPVNVKVTLESRCGQTTTALETSVRPRRNIM